MSEFPTTALQKIAAENERTAQAFGAHTKTGQRAAERVITIRQAIKAHSDVVAQLPVVTR